MTHISEHIWQTSIASWPEELLALALPCQQINIGADDLSLLAAWAAGQTLDNEMLSDDFSTDLGTALEACPEGAHLRYDLCSLKLGPRPPQIVNTRGFQQIAMRANARVASLLMAHQTQRFPLSLYVFAWQQMPPWSEFRVFIKERRVIGISQYHHDRAFAEMAQILPALRPALVPFSNALLQALHMEDVVADIFVEMDTSGRAHIRLMELNPFLQRTDPCMFSWKNGGDFDGSIRYRSQDGNGHPYA